MCWENGKQFREELQEWIYGLEKAPYNERLKELNPFSLSKRERVYKHLNGNDFC